MTWAVVASILGSLATIFGGVRWLLGVYFKQQVKLDAARKVAFAAEARLLQNDVKELKDTIRFHREQLRAVLSSSENALAQFTDSKAAAQRVFETLKEFVASTEKRFEKIENGKEVTAVHHEPPDTIEMKDVPQEKLGKVIVKK